MICVSERPAWQSKSQEKAKAPVPNRPALALPCIPIKPYPSMHVRLSTVPAECVRMPSWRNHCVGNELVAADRSVGRVLPPPRSIVARTASFPSAICSGEQGRGHRCTNGLDHSGTARQIDKLLICAFGQQLPFPRNHSSRKAISGHSHQSTSPACRPASRLGLPMPYCRVWSSKLFDIESGAP